MTKTLTQIIEGEMHSLFASAKVSFLAYILLLLKVAHIRRPQARQLLVASWVANAKNSELV